MDASILQLFTADEILERLARKKSTGCFKIFSPPEVADVFLKNGIIVAVVNGPVDGEEALRQILKWKDALFLWQQDLAAPTSLKPAQINVADFLAAQMPSRLTSTTRENGAANSMPHVDKTRHAPHRHEIVHGHGRNPLKQR